ncbi:hypothetical protein C8Q80DRAFT_713066 [Daedaleopsis nitida]|nr:hypothetical protein C8Q80DRAFT_713066 [Daedaleopsis nitida]
MDEQALTVIRDNSNTSVQEWENTIKRHILKLGEIISLPGDVRIPLDLAIAMFACGWYNEDLCYPDLLARERPHVWRHPDIYTATVSKFAKALDTRSAINLDDVRVDRAMVDNLRAIVEACGLDPLRATRQDLERCETRLYCARSRCQIEQSFRNDSEVEQFTAIRFVELGGRRYLTPKPPKFE